MVPLRPEVHPGQIAYNLLITQQMLGRSPAQIIFPDCSNPGVGELFIYLPPLLFVIPAPIWQGWKGWDSWPPRPDPAYKRPRTELGLMPALVWTSQPPCPGENHRCVLPGPPRSPRAQHGQAVGALWCCTPRRGWKPRCPVSSPPRRCLAGSVHVVTPSKTAGVGTYTLCFPGLC